ncbi:hypothetical protein NRB56_76490 [Nocardia sp. RB56]|uniref:Uncharacterized protein n=1 Tax=Nocardia aurantia TaxID=2585199 RepID=A0A7K0E3P4_9NOCA|nr:hypothetical protein [Nocardia aurantia]
MTINHINHRHLQRRHIQLTRQPNGEMDVVNGITGVEAIQEPHPLLRQRQRHESGALAGDECRAGAAADLRRHPRGQRRDRGRLEQGAHRHLGAQRDTQPGRNLRRDQRIAADGEEVVVPPEPTVRAEIQYVGEDLGDDLLDRGRRGLEFANLEHGRG